jgi:transposase
VFRLDARLKVYLHREAIDGRKNINGLALLVEQELGLDPFAATAYVFSNRRRNRVKILLWDRTGFWLLMKRLEADRFAWPKASAVVELTVEQLHWLLEGIDLSAMRAHPERKYQRVG